MSGRNSGTDFMVALPGAVIILGIFGFVVYLVVTGIAGLIQGMVQ